MNMYVSALHHLGSLYSEMNNAELAYKVLRKAAAMRPDRKDISCSLFMAQRRYGIWNVRVAWPATRTAHSFRGRTMTTWPSLSLTCGLSACCCLAVTASASLSCGLLNPTRIMTATRRAKYVEF
jgi:hypothetical protein